MSELKSDAEPDKPTSPTETRTEQTDWHRILGVLFYDAFEGTSFDVKVEFDVAVTPKMVDIVVQAKKGNLPFAPVVADGIEELREHNLFTFKSHQETFTAKTLEELVGYYSGYLKTLAPLKKKELDRDLVRLFAISTRRPSDVLDNPKIPSKEIHDGVYDLEYGVTPMRLIVINELEHRRENANLLLFSNIKGNVQYGMKEHQLGESKYKSLIARLLNRYEEEGDEEMANLLNPTEDDAIEIWAQRESARKKFLKKVSTEDRLEGIPAEKCLEGVTDDDILKKFTPEHLAELARLAAEKAKQPPENPNS